MRIFAILVGLGLWAGAPVAAQQKIQLPSADRAATLTVQTIFSVGVADGEPWESFAQVWQVAFDREGRLYVLDTDNQCVHVYSPTGKFVRTIGRRGNGPGEFQSPLGIAITAAGELVVNDALRGLQVFSLDGSFKRTHSLKDRSGEVVSYIHAHGTDGVFGEIAPVLRAGMQFQGGPPQTPPRTIGYLPSSGEVRPLYVAPPPQTQRTEMGSDRAFVAQMPIAFAPRLTWVVLPDRKGIAAANGLDYRITLVDDQGTQTRVIERAIAPRKVTQADRDAYLNASENEGFVVVTGPNARPGAAERIREARRERLRNMRFAESMPVIQKLAADPTGRIWVQRSGTRSADDGPVDLISPEGNYLGTLNGQKLPSAFGPDGRVAYIERDDLGVSKVVVKIIR